MTLVEVAPSQSHNSPFASHSEDSLYCGRMNPYQQQQDLPFYPTTGGGSQLNQDQVLNSRRESGSSSSSSLAPGQTFTKLRNAVEHPQLAQTYVNPSTAQWTRSVLADSTLGQTIPNAEMPMEFHPVSVYLGGEQFNQGPSGELTMAAGQLPVHHSYVPVPTTTVPIISMQQTFGRSWPVEETASSHNVVQSYSRFASNIHEGMSTTQQTRPPPIEYYGDPAPSPTLPLPQVPNDAQQQQKSYTRIVPFPESVRANAAPYVNRDPWSSNQIAQSRRNQQEYPLQQPASSPHGYYSDDSPPPMSAPSGGPSRRSRAEAFYRLSDSGRPSKAFSSSHYPIATSTSQHIVTESDAGMSAIVSPTSSSSQTFPLSNDRTMSGPITPISAIQDLMLTEEQARVLAEVKERRPRGRPKGSRSKGKLEAKEWMCPLCSRKFTRKFNLQQHLRVHEGTKPYRCPFEGCDLSFSREYDMRRHTGTVHAVTRPHRCTMCNASFARRDALVRHTSASNLMGVCPLVSPEAEERPQGDTSSNAGGSESLSPRLSLPPPPLTPLAPSDTVAPFQLSASAIDTPPPLFGAQSVQSTRGNMYGPESSYTGAAPLITYYSVDSNLASPKFAPPQSSLMGKSSFAQLTPAPAQQFRVGPTSTNLRAPSMSAAPITYVQLNSESEQVSEPGEFHHQRFSSTAGGPPSLTPLGGLAFSLPESAEQGPMSSNEGGFGGSNKRQA